MNAFHPDGGSVPACQISKIRGPDVRFYQSPVTSHQLSVFTHDMISVRNYGLILVWEDEQ